jgi:hypothetical protein
MKSRLKVGTHCHSEIEQHALEIMSASETNILIGPVITVHAVFSTETAGKW